MQRARMKPRMLPLFAFTIANSLKRVAYVGCGM